MVQGLCELQCVCVLTQVSTISGSVHHLDSNSACLTFQHKRNCLLGCSTVIAPCWATYGYLQFMQIVFVASFVSKIVFTV
jgi:hypothetical protein